MASKKKSIKIIFLGTPEFAIPTLEMLYKDDLFKIQAVFCEPDRPFGRKQKVKKSPIKIFAEKLNLKIFQPEKIKKEENFIRALKPDLAIVVAYGQIISKKILEIPKFGFLNIHPSLLPKYRGPSPIQNAILGGDKETGISIMLLDEKMDHGPILARKKIKIKKNETAESLHDKLSKFGANLISEIASNWVSKKIKPQPQNHKKATFTKLLKREDGKIDWKKSTEKIERKIRAYSPWPGTFTEIGGKRLKIISASIKNNALILEKVQLEGKKEVNWKEFKRGNTKLCEKLKKITNKK